LTGTAIILGASGGIGSAFLNVLENSGHHDTVLGFSRSSRPSLQLQDEASIRACAEHAGSLNGDVRLIFDATGALTLDGIGPEKSMRDLDPEVLAQSFAVNAVGPALLMKHFLPLLPRTSRCVFATLSARVGSIGDNRLGGWYSYRASKAALNQLVRSASVELARRNPQAICVVMHPGTVRTSLTEGFAKTGLEVQEPLEAARRIFDVIQKLTPSQSGGFFDQLGRPVPW